MACPPPMRTRSMPICSRSSSNSTKRKERRQMTQNAVLHEYGLGKEAVGEISSALRQLLADVFALYLKTKNFLWHMTGRHFRDYHLLLDERAGQIFDMSDDIAERARKIGASTLHSIGDIARHQRLKDNDDKSV